MSAVDSARKDTESKEKEEKKNSNDTGKIELPLKCNQCHRNYALSIIANESDAVYSIVQSIRNKYDRSVNIIVPHIHLIWPFFGVDKKNRNEPTFKQVSSLLNQYLSFDSFTIQFDTIHRKNANNPDGKEFFYLVPNKESLDKINGLQSKIVYILCQAFYFANKDIKNANVKQVKKNVGAATKKGKRKGTKNAKFNTLADSQSIMNKSCLELEQRNVDYSPHMTLGQTTLNEFENNAKKILFQMLSNYNVIDKNFNNNNPTNNNNNNKISKQDKTKNNNKHKDKSKNKIKKNQTNKNSAIQLLSFNVSSFVWLGRKSSDHSYDIIQQFYLN